MTQINQLGRVAIPGGDRTVKNYSANTDIAAKLVVILDTTNTPASGTPKGVTLPASDAKPYGVSLTTLVAGKLGQIQVMGSAVCTASGTIHVGDYLMCDSAGKVLAQTATHYQVGIAESEALTGEDVLVFLQFAKNA